MASVVRWMAVRLSFSSKKRRAEIVGGVLEPPGVGKDGVRGRSVGVLVKDVSALSSIVGG